MMARIGEMLYWAGRLVAVILVFVAGYKILLYTPRCEIIFSLAGLSSNSDQVWWLSYLSLVGGARSAVYPLWPLTRTLSF